MPNFSISDKPIDDKPKPEKRRKIEKKPHPRNRFVDSSDLYSETLGSTKYEYISKKEEACVEFIDWSLDHFRISKCGRFAAKILGTLEIEFNRKPETHCVLLYFKNPLILIEQRQSILMYHPDSILYNFRDRDEWVILRQLANKVSELLGIERIESNKLPQEPESVKMTHTKEEVKIEEIEISETQSIQVETKTETKITIDLDF
jgi:hypothetical protein